MQLGECCSRCVRLGLDCVARISRQGQRPQKRKRALTAGGPLQHDSEEKVSEDGKVLQAFLSVPSSSSSPVAPKRHYGLRYLIHSWSSFALARRSFALLERACHLAVKCDIPMDDIFNPSRRNVIQPILYSQNDDVQNTVEEIPLQWNDLPALLKNLCRLDYLENRYIMIREAKNGHSRYLASDKFQQDIVSVRSMEQTWKANDKPVVRLFLQGSEDFAKFAKAIHYQISRYANPDKAPEYMRINGINVMFINRLSSTTRVQEMDLVYAFEIVNLEHSFYVCEFVLPKSNPREETSSSAVYPTVAEKIIASSDGLNTATQTTLPVDVSLEDPIRMFDNLLPLENELDDQDFEAFLALLND